MIGTYADATQLSLTAAPELLHLPCHTAVWCPLGAYWKSRNAIVSSTCSTLSSLPMVSKQKTLPSSPRQYRYAPRGDSHDATKSPPSFFPDWNVFTTCRRQPT